jgi:hypothetical protein
MREDRRELEALAAVGAVEPDEAWQLRQGGRGREVPRYRAHLIDWLPTSWTSLEVEAELPLAMNQRVSRPSRRSLRITVGEDELDLVLVLMQRTADGWKTHLPTPSRQDLVRDLRVEASGQRVIYVHGAVGEQWAVALAPAELLPDWSESSEGARWQPLWSAIASGEVRGGSVELP